MTLIKRSYCIQDPDRTFAFISVGEKEGEWVDFIASLQLEAQDIKSG